MKLYVLSLVIIVLSLAQGVSSWRRGGRNNGRNNHNRQGLRNDIKDLKEMVNDLKEDVNECKDEINDLKGMVAEALALLGNRCPVGKVYKTCGTACPPTCENPEPAICTLQCVTGCFCPKDKVSHNNECISSKDCPQR